MSGETNQQSMTTGEAIALLRKKLVWLEGYAAGNNNPHLVRWVDDFRSLLFKATISLAREEGKP